MKNLANIFTEEPIYKNRMGSDYLKPKVLILKPEEVPVPWTRKYHFKAIHRLALPSTVPIKIKNQFKIALNTALYSLFCYELWDVATHKAVDCFELTLREALIEAKDLKKVESLSKMIDQAASIELLTETEREASHQLRKCRNRLSHGYSDKFGIPSLLILESCRILIINLSIRTWQRTWPDEESKGVVSFEASGPALIEYAELNTKVSLLKEITL